MNHDLQSMQQLVDFAMASGNPEPVVESLQSKESEAPYASLVHILRAMVEDSPENRFKAAIFAPDRGILKDLMLTSDQEPQVLGQQAVESLTEVLPDPEPEANDASDAPEPDPEPVSEPVKVTESVPTVSESDKRASEMKSPSIMAPPAPSQPTPSSPEHRRRVALWSLTPLSIVQEEKEMDMTEQPNWEFCIHVDEGQRTGSVELGTLVQGIVSLHSDLPNSLREEMKNSGNEDRIVQRFLARPPAVRKRPSMPAIPSSENEPTVNQQAIESLKSDGNLVTETLALLHLKQNHPEEAIRIYEQLSLRYPEKKGYFTGQIQKIKDQHI